MLPARFAHLLVSAVYFNQLWLLLALLRLFRGQKWNPLLRRVDTAPPSVDQVRADA